ncbi:MAG: hypothetical protein ACTHJ8_15730 [Mucilaginibacter sp.]
MMTNKNKSGKSGNKDNPLNPSKRPNERPANKPPGQKEEIMYPHESESVPQREGADASFTERNDVTPPEKKEFPSVGPSKTDFESRKLGRTTGRMIGHEPGTENI